MRPFSLICFANYIGLIIAVQELYWPIHDFHSALVASYLALERIPLAEVITKGHLYDIGNETMTLFNVCGILKLDCRRYATKSKIMTICFAVLTQYGNVTGERGKNTWFISLHQFFI